MTDTLGGTYTTGTIAVAANGTVVTGTGTLWSVVAEEGDWLFANGNIGVINSTITDGQLNFILPWTGGALSGASYVLLKMSWLRYEPALTQAKVREFIADLTASGVFLFVTGAAPDPGLGTEGQWALKTDAGFPWLLWQRIGGTWVAQASMVGYGGSSTTSLTVGSGTKVFTTQGGLAYDGARVRAAYTVDHSTWMEGIATYSGTTLSLACDTFHGTGTFASWVFTIAGQPGDMQKSDNLSGLASVSASRANLGIFQDVLFGTAQNFNTKTVTGLYTLTGGDTNAPPGTSGFYLRVQAEGVNGYCLQEAWDIQTGVKYKRVSFASVWTSWSRDTTRIRLTANTVFNVTVAGSDTTGDGLTVGTAWRNTQKALDIIADNYDLAGFRADIQHGAGTYTQSISFSKFFIGSSGAGSVRLLGQSQASGACTLALGTPGVITCTGSNLVANQPVYLTTTGALLTGLTTYTQYYVLAAGLTANNFSVAATPGGAAIAFTGTQSGSHVVTTTPNVIFSTTGDCVSLGALAYGRTDFTIAGIKCTSSAGNLINSSGACNITLGTPGLPFEYGPAFQTHIVGNHSGNWIIAGTNNIVSGGGIIHVAPLSGSTIALHGTNEVYLNGINFTGFWADCESNAQLFVDAMTFTGTFAAVTCPRFIRKEGYINLGTSVLPGVGYLDFPSTVPRGYIDGFTLHTPGSSNLVQVDAGVCADSTSFFAITLLAQWAKTTAAFAVGYNVGGLDTGTIANNTWYHIYVITRLDTLQTDVLFSLSATSPTLPTNYQYFRRVGSMKTDGSGNWRQFSQRGQQFLWDVPINDVLANSTGTSAVLRTLSVPTGIKVEAIIALGAQGNNEDARGLASSPDVADITPGTLLNYGNSVTTGGQLANYMMGTMRTNTSGQIRTRNTASSSSIFCVVNTYGWYDSRGTNS